MHYVVVIRHRMDFFLSRMLPVVIILCVMLTFITLQLTFVFWVQAESQSTEVAGREPC